MTALLIVARALLALLFAVAGAAKLADRDGAAEAARGFGVPSRAVGAVALLLPLAELALAAALLPPATAPYAAVAAAALLLGFAAVIARAVRAGATPDCHCFGQLHSAPAGRATLLRNALLAALAGGVAAGALLSDDGAPSLTSWLGALSDAALVGLGAGLALAVVVAAFGWFGIELLRQNGRLLERLEALEAGAGVRPAADGGAPAPDVPLTDLAGEQVELHELLDERLPLLLVFSDPACGPCRALLPEVAGWQRELTDSLAVAVVGRGEAAEAYGVAGTPSALLIAPDGTIAAGPVGGAEAIRELVAEATAADEPRTLAPGDALPAFELPALAGGSLRDGDLVGAPALIVFWDPGCGFCDGMRDDLLRLDARLAQAGARLVVISSGDEQATRALGLHATVALDPGFTVGFAAGAAGTPSALLTDADGRLVAAPATGAADLLTLAQELPAPSPAA